MEMRTAKNGDQLSLLGFGCMRLPIIEGNSGQINEPLVANMVAHALDSGINYFDTAYMYHEGKSESVIGRVLSAYPRNKFN